MPLVEILRIAFASIGVNKLRSILTMLGITIGVFSVIGVMTTISALRGSIETGLSFLGSNTFQFSKWPFAQGGPNHRKYELRRNITPDVTFGGTNEYFLNANQYSIDLGRNLQPEDIELARPVIVIGQDVVKKLFPSENPLGKTIKLKGRTYVVIGTFAEKGTTFGQSDDNIAMIPITRFFSDMGTENYTVNIATAAPSHLLYNDTMDKGVTMMRIVRGLSPEAENDFEVYSNDSILGIFGKVADIVTSASFVISGIALLAAGVGIMNIMLVSVTERTKEICLLYTSPSPRDRT